MTPDDPKKFLDLVFNGPVVVEIKTVSGEEVPDIIKFNGIQYNKHNECMRLPDKTGSYVTVHKVLDNGGTFSQDFLYFQCSRCGCYVMDNAAFCPACGAEVVDDANA